VRVIAAIDTFVERFAVLDLLTEKNLIHIYAIRISDFTRNLDVLSLSGDYNEMHYQTKNLDSEDCGGQIEVSESVIVMSCQVTRTISIWRRSTMVRIFK